jgi:hypothetical protein
MKYSVFGASGSPSTTAATAGIMKVDNPSASTMAAAKIFEWSIGPHANSADETYAVEMKRQSTAGTWTNAVTPSPLDAKASASVTTAARVSTAAGTAGVVLGTWGYHLRGGYRWVSIPGGELTVPLTFSNGIILEYTFAQGTSVQDATFYFDE